MKSFDYFTIHFDKKWLEKISTDIYFNDNIISNTYIYKEFLSIATKILKNPTKCINNRLNCLLKIILNDYGKNNNNHKNKIILKVEKFILKNIDEQITLDEISQEIGYSKEHIIRVFKAELGLTPHAFLMNEKVNKVKEMLLRKHEQNISQIALSVGFYDQSHLSKFFKKSFAITPNMYKKIGKIK